MKDSVMEVLLPKIKTIVVCGERIEIGPLSWRKIDKALKLMAASAVRISTEKEMDDKNVLMKLAQDLGENVGDMVSIITGQPIEKTKDVSLEDVSELAVAVAETNDFGKIFSNFNKAMELSLPKK
jgi:hypothetical protein